MSEPNYHEEMKLPPGKTCIDCDNLRRCTGIGCTKPENTSCDWWPNRFRQASPDVVAERLRRP